MLLRDDDAIESDSEDTDSDSADKTPLEAIMEHPIQGELMVIRRVLST